YLFLCSYRIWRRIAWASAAVAAALYCCLSPYQQGVALFASALWGLYYGWPPPRLWRGSARTPARAYAGGRSWPLGKPLLVAGAWAWVTVMLPMDPADWWAARWMLLERASFVFALALAYNLHDVEHDARVGLHTLALRLRERRTFHLIYAALGVTAAAAAVSVFQGKYAAPVGAALGISLGGSAFALRAMFRETFPLCWRKAAIDALMLAQAALVAEGLFIAASG
ncbi:MAG TPA: UbiA family prenyltransferase, partial [Saprospiraceae bacterium]|nr:UbiA family prenyltransferase [Saprospiraceae bacterium]